MSDDQIKPDENQPDPRPEDVRKKQLVKAGVAAGIGSAAIVAALLYAKGARRNPN